MTINELLTLGIKKLKSTLDAEVLLSHVLDKSKEYLLTNPDRLLSAKDEKQFKILLNRRQKGWPVPYITNHKEFFGLNFHVDKDVLIPRAETEGLVELVLNHLKTTSHQLHILDIGTGSGAIIISLAKNLSAGGRIKFFASDISTKALKIAKRNAKRNSVAITFKQGSLLKPWKKERFDIIVANLPYLAKETDSSTKHEPKIALIAKNQGLALIEELFKQLSLYNLQPITYNLFLEIGHNQGPQIKKLAAKLLPDFDTKILKDLSGRTRYAVLVLPRRQAGRKQP